MKWRRPETVDRRVIAATVDYETWQPIPPGRVIDWEADILGPAERLMQLFESHKAPLTFFAEMGEYFWLERHQPRIAALIASQLQDAIRRGHDVQLHLHPNWLPELGARYENGNWSWDWSVRTLHDSPIDPTALIGRCKNMLESIARAVKSDYLVTCFRAGGYSAQPFDRIYDALRQSGIYCDSSVYAGGTDAERKYDYTLAWSTHQPYLASRFDPQLKAPPGERSVIEIPIFAYERGRRWCLDGNEGARLADHFFKYEKNRLFNSPRVSGGLATVAWRHLSFVNWPVPRSLAYRLTEYGPAKELDNQYFVMVGHTKALLDFSALDRGLGRLREDGCEFSSLSSIAREAYHALLNSMPQPNEMVRCPTKELCKGTRNFASDSVGSAVLTQMIPLDRQRVLEISCDPDHWSPIIAELHPWMTVQVAAPSTLEGNDSCWFDCLRPPNPPVSSQWGSFDCVYANNSLQRCSDVSRVLADAYRLLADGGTLVALISSDARNPLQVNEDHPWKAAPHEIRQRLLAAGFTDIRMSEADTYRRFGAKPYPPSLNRLTYLTAWKRCQPISCIHRIQEAMEWVYNALKPGSPAHCGDDACQIISKGYGMCLDYCIVLGRMLQREGYRVTWCTMVAEGHPAGRGLAQRDSHEVLLIDTTESQIVVDPTTNTCHFHCLAELLRQPTLAVGKAFPDHRYNAGNFHLYDTAEWYGRVARYQLRSDIATSAYFVPWRRNQYFQRNTCLSDNRSCEDRPATV
jgi:SAM-dependent methyltransferase